MLTIDCAQAVGMAVYHFFSPPDWTSIAFFPIGAHSSRLRNTA
jgi:hypothetical protein